MSTHTAPTRRKVRSAIERAAGMTRVEASEIVLNIRTSSSFSWLAIAPMKVDPRAQRLLRPVWVKRHEHCFNPDQLGVICVSKRSDGSVWIIDGQHRVELLRAVGWGDQKAYCEVFDGLSIREEAALFLARNDKISVRTYDKFMAGVTAEQPINVAIIKIVQAAGLKIAEGNVDGAIGAVSSLQYVYGGAGMASEREGERALRRALGTLKLAWGGHAGSFEGPVIEALGLIYLRYGSKIDDTQVVTFLAKLPGGTGKLVQQGRALKDSHGGRIGYNIADAIVLGYNRKRRTGKLEHWRS